MASPQQVQEIPCVEVFVPLLYDDESGIETENQRNSKFLDRQKITTTSSNNDNRTENQQTQADVFAEKFAILFYRVTGKDELLDAYELQMVMERMHASEIQNFNNKTFSLETCRCMVASIDKNRHGNLNFDQFKRLWFQLMSWKDLFEECDQNKDKKIDENELRIAVRKLGFTLQDGTLLLLISRYANRSGTLNLDDFCGICSKLNTLKQDFDDMCTSNKELTYDRFLMGCLYS